MNSKKILNEKIKDNNLKTKLQGQINYANEHGKVIKKDKTIRALYKENELCVYETKKENNMQEYQIRYFIKSHDDYFEMGEYALYKNGSYYTKSYIRTSSFGQTEIIDVITMWNKDNKIILNKIKTNDLTKGKRR